MMDGEELSPKKRKARERMGLEKYYKKERHDMLDVAEDNDPSDGDKSESDWDEEPMRIPDGKVWDPIRERFRDRICMDDFDEQKTEDEKRKKLRDRWDGLMKRRKQERPFIPEYWSGDSDLELSDFEAERKRRRRDRRLRERWARIGNFQS
jgi:hypothetical protein